jgi:bifunctional N-acetylglucosamine-1-phosphate-uridyltransferase/glucosamine-1-phosphate-acetyltransferase GlmU-like protein
VSAVARGAAGAVADHVAAFAASPWAPLAALPPWRLTEQIGHHLRALIATLPSDAYRIEHDVAVHRSATVEGGAVLKGPLVIGPRCFVAAGAYLRGGAWLDADCIVGPGAELKTSLMFAASKLAHFNFVGDSILGSGVNLEAGAIVCNYRNERADKQIFVALAGALVATGVSKFGALLGDGCRLGANAVVAPGAILRAGTVIARAQLFDAETAYRGAGHGAC